MDNEEIIKGYHAEGVYSKEDVLFSMVLFLVDRELSRHSTEYYVDKSINQYRKAYEILPYSHELKDFSARKLTKEDIEKL